MTLQIEAFYKAVKYVPPWIFFSNVDNNFIVVKGAIQSDENYEILASYNRDWNLWQAAIASMQGESKSVSPQYFMYVDGDNNWFECPDDISVIEDAFGTAGNLKVGDEYEVYASHTYKQKYRITKLPDDVDDDTNVEMVSSECEFFAYPPSAASKIAEQDARIKELEQQLEVARKDAGRWQAICNLWFLCSELKLIQNKDGGYSICEMEFVDNLLVSDFCGDTPEQTIDAAIRQIGGAE